MNHRQRRHIRIRKKIAGTASRPRVVVFRSNKNLYLQAIDDSSLITLAAASTLKDENPAKALAIKLRTKKIKKVVFDRGGYLYHGQIKKIAENLRKEGMEF